MQGALPPRPTLGYGPAYFYLEISIFVQLSVHDPISKSLPLGPAYLFVIRNRILVMLLIFFKFIFRLHDFLFFSLSIYLLTIHVIGLNPSFFSTPSRFPTFYASQPKVSRISLQFEIFPQLLFVLSCLTGFT